MYSIENQYDNFKWIIIYKNIEYFLHKTHIILQINYSLILKVLIIYVQKDSNNIWDNILKNLFIRLYLCA